MSTDESVPEDVRKQYAEDWGYCGDEFTATDGFPPQLYVREARRLVGDQVLTQNLIQKHEPMGNLSVGMGCYNFDSHCVEYYACTDPDVCVLYNKSYTGTECHVGLDNPGIYQMPLWLLFPKREQVTNLLVPVCSSASHVAYATVRMEPQFMILGHAAGVAAALSVQAQTAVQDVNPDDVTALLLADGALLTP